MINLKDIRERINLRIFDIREPAIKTLGVLTFLVILFGLGVIIYFFGFSPNSETSFLLVTILQRVLDFFVIKFLITLFFEFNPVQYLKKNFWESIIMLLILSETVIYFGFGQSYWQHLTQILGLSVDGYFFVVQIFFWMIVLYETGRTGLDVGNLRINPASMLALSFLLLILLGTALLKMPEMTNGKGISWADALFTSTSACCVTGLIVQDTAVFFSFKGQFILMVLFQLGGLNMLMIATFIGTFYRRSGSLHTMHFLRDFLDTDKTSNLHGILRRVVYYSFVIELCGALFLYFLWGTDYSFKSNLDRAFFSVFHSVSAFNNAGFSLFTNNLFESTVRFQYGAQLIIMVLIVAGGLGFIVLQDLFSVSRWRSKRRYKREQLMVNTRLVLSVTSFLLLFGAGMFFICEYDHTLKGLSLPGKVVTSLFQSATTRTAGFNTVDLNLLTKPMLLLFAVFMFVGASPGSTGGGIKTTTLAVVLKATVANIRGREHVEFYKRNISWRLVNKSYAIIILALIFLFVFSMLLAFTNPQFSFKEIIFEEISAMGTVGLSLGITSQMTVAGKLILIVSMFVGRIGTLTMGIIFSRKVQSKNYRYPNARLMVS